MNVTVRNILLNLIYYGVTAIGLPWAGLSIETWVGLGRYDVAFLRAVAVAFVFTGVVLQLWCIVLFQTKGQGSPSPLLPTQALVVAGPYRLVRNPMNLGEVAVFFGEAFWFGSPVLIAYALLSFLLFHIFVILHEEKRLARSFGPRYENYRSEVGRWIPKV